MHIWISPGTIGTAINPTASVSLHVHQMAEMTKGDKHNMDAYGITRHKSDRSRGESHE